MLNDQYLIDYLGNVNDVLHSVKDVLLYDARSRQPIKNPLNHFGNKVFSQTDEDGITLEIMRRIGIERGVFTEFGVGNGLENNTLVLAAVGWTGFWVDTTPPAVNIKKVTNPRFAMMNRYVSMDNILDTMQQGLAYTGNSKPDFVSFDFEGNDYYLIEKLLSNEYLPQVFLVEYNAKFMPPIEWKVEYSADNAWAYDDYFGASLMSFVKLFEQHGYFLACCNQFTGSNAYFIQEQHRDKFADIPTDIRDIWMKPQYYLPRLYGHQSSPRTVESILNKLNS